MFSDDSGADFLPGKFFVIVIVAALLVVIMASGLADLSGACSTYRARAEAERIYEFARLAYAGGCLDGASEKTLAVSIPASVRTITFGAMPANGTLVRMDRSYFLEYSDGRLETYVADMPFACDGPDGPADIPVLLYPGQYCIKARPASVNGSYKACIRAEAA